MIKYRAGYKYQLYETYTVKTAVSPGYAINHEFIELSEGGLLTIKAGYAWDGPSGPAIDTPNFMRGSLVHDALYQLMRQKILDVKWRKQADDELRIICREDGMSWIRAWWVYQGVRIGAESSALPQNARKILEAP